MKTQLALPIIILAICSTFVACNPGKKKIVVPADYGVFMGNGTKEKSSIQACEAAIQFWELQYAKDPKNSTALLKLAGLHANYFKLNGEIKSLLLSDSLLQQAVTQYAFDDASIYQLLAVNATTKHEFWKAKQYIEKAIEKGEHKAASYFTLTDILVELGKVDTAEIILNNFRNKNQFAWLIRQAKVLDHKGDLPNALVLMEKALQKVKRNDELFCWTLSNLGDMYGHAGRIEDSYASYLAVLKRKPDYDYALKGIAWIAFAHDKNIVQAQGILDHLQKKKTVPDYYLLLAEMAKYTGKENQKDSLLAKFTQLVRSPKYSNMYNRHFALLQAEEWNNGIAASKIARNEIATRPTPESYDLLAWSLYHAGKFKDALQIAQTYVENRSFEPASLYHLGMIYRANGFEKQGREYLDQALQGSFELGPLKTEAIQLALAS
jgi:tetratricopeptide (TPR) repeat protein